MPADPWRLKIHGLVENPVTLAWSGFMALPQFKDTSDLHCVTTWSQHDMEWQGVAFLTLAELVRPKREAAHVFFKGYDGYTSNNPLDALMDDDVLVVQQRTSSGHSPATCTRGRDLSGSQEGAGGIGGLLARTAHSGSSPYQPSSHAYYHADGNGNVAYLLNQARTHGASYKYDPYGRLIASSGGLSTGNLLRFSSKLWHDYSETYYYGYRFYLPEGQRWINRDPLGEEGGINLYLFCANSPIGYWDLYGLSIRKNIQRFLDDYWEDLLDSLTDTLYERAKSKPCKDDCLASCDIAYGVGLAAVGASAIAGTAGCVAMTSGLGAAGCTVAVSLMAMEAMEKLHEGLFDCRAACQTKP